MERERMSEKVRAIIDARDREWSNRLESQDLVRPDSPDLDIAIAWYVSQKRLGKSPGRTLTRQETSESAKDGMDSQEAAPGVARRRGHNPPDESGKRAGAAKELGDATSAPTPVNPSDPSDTQTVDEIERAVDLVQQAKLLLLGPHSLDPRAAERLALDVSISALAALARRLAKENAALAEQAFAANSSKVETAKRLDEVVNERDEARRLHDSHCPGVTSRFGKCTPAWRPR